ncbi:helix-turn-helix domain-containing protein [Pseudobdellovibrio exovorus]|uniref:HTH cro/C1-type domain-containing protein n=1 Tax=Pseudobdellovibrio exovorus JSS TaxID=1184267 RepID=M4VCA9_9BACT|nr:helix-turn-helix domain-containing protein [Pseudobdellovibrio exovorus]AGH95671.1 hypothetical protein A11Q_1455 [Pseudobdellovibrio exovorus JSS]
MAKVNKPKDIGRLIQQKRKKKKLSQTDLAEMCGVGRRFISELEGGKKETYDLGLTLRVLNRMGFELQIGDRESEV